MRFMNVNFCSESATNITASSSDPSFPVSNLKHPFRSKRWRSTDVDSEWVVFDMITTEAIDSVVVLWPKEDGIRLSNTAVIKIQANATNTWTSPAVDQTLTIDNDYVLASHFFSSDQSYRYWRILITDSGNPNGFIELGVVWLGKSLSVPNAQNGFKYSLVDQSKVVTTDFGHPYVDQYPQMAILDLSFQVLDYDEIQILENAFRRNGINYPVLAVVDPDGAVFDKDHYLVYGKLSSKFENEHVNYDIFNADGIVITEIA